MSKCVNCDREVTFGLIGEKDNATYLWRLLFPKKIGKVCFHCIRWATKNPYYYDKEAKP